MEVIDLTGEWPQTYIEILDNEQIIPTSGPDFVESIDLTSELPKTTVIILDEQREEEETEAEEEEGRELPEGDNKIDTSLELMDYEYYWPDE